MLKEETTAEGVNDPVLTSRHSGIKDVFIKVRETVLNRLTGANSSLVLNSGLVADDMPPPSDLAARLKETLDTLKVSVMDETGSEVDYAALRNSPAYIAYRDECLAALPGFMPQKLLTQDERRAFWINLYNALVIDAVITFGVRRSVIEGRLGLLAFFRRAAYLVDGRRISLEDIEHGILRGNRGNPYIPGPHFPSDDPRLAWSLPIDLRIHFALNCGGRSCPPIRSYHPEKLSAQLDLAARGFVNETTMIQPESDQLLLSQIFRWYEADFGGRQGVVEFLAKSLPDDDRREVLISGGDQLSFIYQRYDWGLNSN